jgi:methionyl-tRNA formyltransferase
MRIVFMGTPRFAADILENLIAQHEVRAVFSRPDAISRRGNRAVPSPVKQVALANDIPVYTVESLRQRPAFELMRDLQPDLIVVAAYGYILPREILDIPPLGCINVHSSILPRWRGAAPVQRAILAGDAQVGVCIMKMEEGLDTGDWCICRTTDVADKPYVELLDELADLGSQALLTAVGMIESGAAEWTAQDAELATYAPKISKGELFIDPGEDRLTGKLKAQAFAAGIQNVKSGIVSWEGIERDGD